MLRVLRRSHRLIAPFAVAIAAMVLLGTFDWWHSDDDDTAPIAVFHDHAAHHPLLGANRAIKIAADHCYLCHWLRTLQSGFRDTSVQAQATAKSGLATAVAAPRPSDLVACLVPARAPPA